MPSKTHTGCCRWCTTLYTQYSRPIIRRKLTVRTVRKSDFMDSYCSSQSGDLGTVTAAQFLRSDMNVRKTSNGASLCTVFDKKSLNSIQASTIIYWAERFTLTLPIISGSIFSVFFFIYPYNWSWIRLQLHGETLLFLFIYFIDICVLVSRWAGRCWKDVLLLLLF